MDTKRDLDSHYGWYHKDGLQDIFLGLGMLFAGLFLWTGMVWMAGIYIPVFLPSWNAARRRFVHRRVGELDHDPRSVAQRQNILLYITLLMGALALAGIGMLFAYGMMSGAVHAWLRAYFLVVLGGVFAGAWVAAGLILKLTRFFLYAAFTFLLLAVAQFTNLPFWAALTSTGGLIIFSGLVVFLRFIQENPVIEEGR